MLLLVVPRRKKLLRLRPRLLKLLLLRLLPLRLKLLPLLRLMPPSRLKALLRPLLKPRLLRRRKLLRLATKPTSSKSQPSGWLFLRLFSA
ncbi:MAG TPA: hypothetical protein VN066_02150 [Rhodocyclaceae bacterium]|nr:hypothetical protein [Rhodocyclaceae bacterium]